MNYLTSTVVSLLLLLSLLPKAKAETQVDWKVHKAAHQLSGDTWFTENETAMFLATPKSNSAQLVNQQDSITFRFSAPQGNRAGVLPIHYKNHTLLIGGVNNGQTFPFINFMKWNNGQPTFSAKSISLPSHYQRLSAAVHNDSLIILLDNHLYAIGIEQLLSTSSPIWDNLGTTPLAQNQSGQLVVQNDGTGRQLFLLENMSISKAKGSQSRIWKRSLALTSTHAQWQEEANSVLPAVTTGFKRAFPLGQSHLIAQSTEEQVFAYNAITKKWTQYQQTLAETQLMNTTLKQLSFQSSTLLALAETTRGYQLLKGTLIPPKKEFGWINMSVLVVYLLFMVAVGLYFVFKNKTTDDYFRGGQSIPWWAAACSIYATMLSSLTYVALPAIVYQTNWVLLIGIWMIVVVAPIAIYVAMPFFRQIDATSAYEYLSKRFNMSVRLFASGLFTLFHIGRMGIVMALTALALSAVTPLTAAESVLIMGVLCLLYCTLGGIEAVIWTDTIQTLVLLVGAVVCFVVIVAGLDGGLTDFVQIGLADDKFTMVNWDFSLNSITTLSIWVIVLGGIGQNLSSYTADQAVVQRYMVTSDPKAAAKSIWTNAAIAGPGALLFVCLGTGLYAFYASHPDKLDPTIQIDQIFPTFIATELPVGLAGLIVAGVFAAAQSTVSTSMNSIATTVVTDFIRPFNLIKTEKGYMSAARWLTFIMGALGTLAGLIFIDPEIRSLMEAYFKVIGMFMGALGGLFVLGALTTKANSTGALIGIFTGVVAMISAWQLGWANGYLYATIGIVSCLAVGYFASLPFANKERDLNGLTLYTMRKADS